MQALASPPAAAAWCQTGKSLRGRGAPFRTSPVAHAQRERNALEWVTEGGQAVTEVARAVRERGVTAFDDTKSFVARGEGGEVRVFL